LRSSPIDGREVNVDFGLGGAHATRELGGCELGNRGQQCVPVGIVPVRR
jgi:hypothetical protein